MSDQEQEEYEEIELYLDLIEMRFWIMRDGEKWYPSEIVIDGTVIDNRTRLNMTKLEYIFPKDKPVDENLIMVGNNKNWGTGITGNAEE